MLRNRGRVEIVARPAITPQVILETDYESMVAVTDGVMTLEDFASGVKINSTEPAAVQQLLALLSAAVQRIAKDAPPADEVPPEEAGLRSKRQRRASKAALRTSRAR